MSWRKPKRQGFVSSFLSSIIGKTTEAQIGHILESFHWRTLADFGGRYITQIVGSGQAHSLFYTNTAIKTAFKNYVKVFVTRYVNEPTIFSWELANEPRCNGCAGESWPQFFVIHRLISML